MFDAKTKERRLEKEAAQADVYEDLQTSRKTYSSWENGLAEPHEKKSPGGWPSASPLKRTLY